MVIHKKIFPRQNPNLDFRDFKSTYHVLKSGEIFSGPLIEEFKRKLSEYIGIKYTILVNLGRSAELVALQGLNFSKGDEIIMPSYNFPIVPIVVKMLGLKPVFVDVEQETFNINPSLIEKNISSKTKAIFITHMCGHPCEMEKIVEIKKKYGLKLIEDAVHSLGAEYKNKKVGTFGDVSYFSFYVGKSMTTFMGAAVCTDNQETFNRMRQIVESYERLPTKRLLKAINYGMLTYFLTKPIIFSFTVYPLIFVLNLFNSQLLDDKMAEPTTLPKELPSYLLTKFTNLQAAVGLSQLRKLSATISKRIKNSYLLIQNIISHPAISLPTIKPQAKHVFLYFFIRVSNRNLFRKELAFKGVDTKRDTNLACSHLDIFKDEYRYCPIAEKISRENILIPNYPSLSEKDILHISTMVNRTAKKINAGKIGQ